MSRKLVAYFSASGVTAKLAEQLSEAIGADLHEIRAKEQYSQADLDWRNDKSRSSIEMKNKTFRPEIVDDKISISEYDTVFVGFPIWWGREPSVVDTFLTAYDFKGKNIIPFCTSGGSEMGNMTQRIFELTGAKVNEGKRLGGSVSEEDLKIWTEGLRL